MLAGAIVTQVQFDSEQQSSVRDYREQISEHRKSQDEKLFLSAILALPSSSSFKLTSEIENLRQHLQPVVMFGFSYWQL